MQLGIERLLQEKGLQKQLAGKRLALLTHPAAVTHGLTHSLDALMSCKGLTASAAFGPQHGLRGDKQDNMVESADYQDPRYNIPVYSLYGEVRRPTAEMMDTFDVLLVDVQDLGCRIYTYATTLLYLLEACAEHGKALWVLDRPNPAGRAVEGPVLEDGWQSFVGASEMILRHGLTLGELAQWFVNKHRLDVDLKVIEMKDYRPDDGPGYGWPAHELAWVNPSPNAASLNMARCYAGTVLLEGTTLSEMRGTTTPLEGVGAPDLDVVQILNKMAALSPAWFDSPKIRPCFFTPSFHKHEGRLCRGFQLHTDHSDYRPGLFRPYRFILLFLKALRLCEPDYPLWHDRPYEYEQDRLAIDLINGTDSIRLWVDDAGSAIADIEDRLNKDEAAWQAGCQSLYRY